ncbi:MAG: glycosyltransferase family 39 protein [Prolixibacteraceae bacterium]|nr:glycosyltransferase family 39 protein [Prolixibacteraceae bacterium]
MKNTKFITYSIVVIAVLVQIIGMLNPFTGDAGKYAAIAKNIFLSGDFFNMTVNGDPYFQKPPFLIWLYTFGFYLFGDANDFTARFFPVLYSFIAIYSTYKFARIFYDKNTSLVAVCFFAFSEIFFLYNNDIHTDVVLTANTTLAIWQIALFIKDKKLVNLIIGFAAVGLSMLTKGPIGLAVPVFAIGSHLLITRNFKMIFNPKWLIGLLVTVIIISPYLVSLYKQSGIEGIIFYFWTNNAGRMDGSYLNNFREPLFYIYNIASLMIPWSVFILAGLFMSIYSIFKNKFKPAENEEFYSFGATILFIIILSMSVMKSPNYLYPVIPFLSIIGARFFTSLSEFAIKKYFTVQIVISIITWLLGVAIITYLFPAKKALVWVIFILLSLFLVVTLTLKTENKRKIIFSGSVLIVLFSFIINAHFLPEVFKYQSSLPASKIYNKEADDNDEFFTWRYSQFEMFFYAKTPGRKVWDEDKFCPPDRITIDEAIKVKGAWYLMDAYTYDQLKEKGVKVKREWAFDHYWLTDINLKFLLPHTRQKQTFKMYLIETE